MSGSVIVVAGGGTAGHVYPTLAVVRELWAIRPELRIAYIGQIGGAERAIIDSMTLPKPLEFIEITAEKLRRYWSFRTIILPIAILRGTVESIVALRRLQPRAVFLKGGYVCLPVALAAWWLRIPIVLHETDASMGLANRLIAPFASKIAVSFARPTFLTHRSDQKIVFTGQPVREEFFKVQSKQMHHDRAVIAVTGSMQGARAINMLIQEILPKLVERYRILHITGPNDFQSLRSSTQSRYYEPISHTSEFYKLVGQADLVISRSGGTIFELAALGKPSILIPLPTAANNHQRENAAIFAEQAAAVVLEQTTLTADQLLKTITELVRDSSRRAALTENIRQFARRDAATVLAKLVLSVADERQG